MMQGAESTHPDAEPMVSEAVNAVRDRFGAAGLRDLIAIATVELSRVQSAEARLASIENAGNVTEAAHEPLDAADTQAWLAYTEVDPEK